VDEPGDGCGEAPVLLGEWTGTAIVDGDDILVDGEYPVVVNLAQSDARVRGVIDIREERGFLAETFGYLVDGEVSVDGTVVLRSTDRICGGGEPKTLCYPNATVEPVFELRGRIDGGALVLDEATVLPGVVYDTGAAIEIPFETLSVEQADRRFRPEPRPFAGTWSGPMTMPQTLVVPLPLPFHGQNSLEIGPGLDLVSFDNDAVGNVYPDLFDLFLGDAFRLDADTGRAWVVQVGTVYYRWLYALRRNGNTMTGIVAFDLFEDPVYDADAAPVDFTDIALEKTVAVINFYFEDEPAR
jgi:hypothetical protein